MKYFSLSIIPEEDCDFLNETRIKHEVRSKSEFGFWMDWNTNLPILGKGDMATFITEDPEDELLLRLRFGERLSG